MVWHAGHARVAVAGVILPGDPASITTELTAYSRSARISDDGKTLLFISNADLTHANSQQVVQAYLYNDDAQAVKCISCTPGGAAPQFPLLYLDFSMTMLVPPTPRNLNSDGRRAFFQTTNSLVPQDDNNAMDVYEWSDGKVSLITDGHSPAARTSSTPAPTVATCSSPGRTRAWLRRISTAVTRTSTTPGSGAVSRASQAQSW